jgi:hypothetical protein
MFCDFRQRLTSEVARFDAFTGGPSYTLYLETERVTPLNVSTQQAQRAVLTGGALAGRDKPA